MNPADHKPMLRRTGVIAHLTCTCLTPLGDLRPEEGMVPVIDRMYRHRQDLIRRERLTRTEAAR